MRIALIGDGESVHLLKWATALSAASDVELWAASSRGFLTAFDRVIPPQRRLALATRPAHGGGNGAILLTLPALGSWLRRLDADWLHAHYLTSHGTLAWLARSVLRSRARIVGSAWGSDILVAPQRSAIDRWVIRRVLKACTLATSDSQHMTRRMQALGAGEVMTFPFGLESMPTCPQAKDDWLFYANRGLEAPYRPDRVLQAFAAISARRPEARLVVANDGALRQPMEALAGTLGLRVGPLESGARVCFVGRLDAAAQSRWYARSRWYLSLPETDSVSVSVLEAMAHGCIPVLSDLPANRELVVDGQNGAILADSRPPLGALEELLAKADLVAAANRGWVEEHALFGPAVDRFLARLRELSP